MNTHLPSPGDADAPARIGRSVSRTHTLFAASGEMAERCRAFNWASTPLGAVETWSQSLRTMADAVLASRNPMLLFWGPDLVQLYNDAFRPSLGPADGPHARHPRALGMRAAEFWTDVWAVVGPQIDGVMSRGEAVWFENLHLPIERNGRLDDAWWTYSYSPVRDDDGRIAGTLVVCIETTTTVKGAQDRERLLATAEAARREAEQANRAKADFLAVMSHELRTPLNAIAGYAELIELGVHGPLTPAQQSALDKIQRSQRHLLGLINGLLNYAKLDAGTVHYDVEDFPIDAVLTTCEALMALQAREKEMTLACRGAPDLIVRADREKLQQVLLNLLTNAVKFTEAGGAVTVECREEGDSVVVWVGDTGPGIPPDHLESIFEPFVQLHSNLTGTRHGVGLGLAISRELARGMGGDLTAMSTVGVGSTFILTLPRGASPVGR